LDPILFRNIEAEQMENSATPNRTTRTYSISVPAELYPQIKAQATANGRTISAYLSWLILQDTAKEKSEKR
jgi:hypothetical protein